MKEFIDKLIARLEEEKGKVVIDGKEMYQEDYFIDIDGAISIVNELAEEMGVAKKCNNHLDSLQREIAGRYADCIIHK